MERYNYEHYTFEEMEEIRRAKLEINKVMSYSELEELEDKIATLLN